MESGEQVIRNQGILGNGGDARLSSRFTKSGIDFCADFNQYLDYLRGKQGQYGAGESERPDRIGYLPGIHRLQNFKFFFGNLSLLEISLLTCMRAYNLFQCHGL